MEFFKFNPTGEQTFLERGQIINDITKSLWVERYSVPGEFLFESQLSTGILGVLPIGSLISHIDTLEVMIVENHEIKEKIDEDAIVTISGRSFPSFLENRIVGANLARDNSSRVPYVLAADNTWDQIVELINDHINSTFDAGDELANITARTTVTGTGESVDRTIEPGTVWERLTEILKVDDLGIKTIRKNAFTGTSAATTDIVIYRGEDKTSEVVFSWAGGDLTASNYLFTNRLFKNSAMVIGRYVYVMVDLGPDKYDRRMMLVDASDIDGHLGEPPIFAPLLEIMAAMTTRGQQALLNQTALTITQADISSSTALRYRRDYNVGDLVILDANYGQMEVRRVTEYAEIEDENGESGHPTLAIPGV